MRICSLLEPERKKRGVDQSTLWFTWRLHVGGFEPAPPNATQTLRRSSVISVSVSPAVTSLSHRLEKLDCCLLVAGSGKSLNQTSSSITRVYTGPAPSPTNGVFPGCVINLCTLYKHVNWTLWFWLNIDDVGLKPSVVLSVKLCLRKAAAASWEIRGHKVC